MRLTQHSFLALIAFAIVFCASAGSHAAVISVQPVIFGYFDPATFAPVPAPSPMPGGGTANPGVSLVVQVDVYIEVLSLAPGEDSFGTAAFSFEIGPTIPGVSMIVPDIDAGGWTPPPLPVDTNGNAPGGIFPSVSVNGDLGADSQDYIGILIQMATGAFTNPLDLRRNFAEPGGHWGASVNVGSAFFEWDGLGEVEITLSPIEVSAKLTNGIFVPGQAPPSAILRLGNNVPEPGSLLLIAVGAFGVTARRR
jgi:hypothetical protein